MLKKINLLMSTQLNIIPCHWFQSNTFKKVIMIFNHFILLLTSSSGKAIISGHSDGSLVRYIFSEENTSETHV